MASPNSARLLMLTLLSTAPGFAVASESEMSERVPPTILFVVDTTTVMQSRSCTGATGSVKCFDQVQDAIGEVIRRNPWATYGVVGMDGAGTVAIAPLGSTYGEIEAGMTSFFTPKDTSRHMGTVLANLAENYISQDRPDDGVDDDEDGWTGDWDESPLAWSCSETHIVVLTRGLPTAVENVPTAYKDSLSTDLTCASASTVGGTDLYCQYDNVVANLYSRDIQDDVPGTQSAVVHTIGLGVTDGSIADQLFESAADQTGGEGKYFAVQDTDGIIAGLNAILEDLRSGTYSYSAPVYSSECSTLAYAYYSYVDDTPMTQGHLRGYAVESDKDSDDYGQVILDTTTTYGGAMWDAGDLLAARAVAPAEVNPNTMDGSGTRDIYFFDSYAYENLYAMRTQANLNRRMSFDADFVDALYDTPEFLDAYLDTTNGSHGCDKDQSYDLNGDCVVTPEDMQLFVDFVRGVPDAPYRYLDSVRGYWRLGSSQYGQPVFVASKKEAFTADRTYRTFLKLVEQQDSPDVVLYASNAGMLHAFSAEPSGASPEPGQELWAWIPGQLLHREQDAEWGGRLFDLLTHGDATLFEGTPVVQDVWMDDDHDGVKECDIDLGLAYCEWHRVALVQQGRGGPALLALDITDTQDPQFLWEQSNTVDPTAMGYTTAPPVVFNLREDGEDRWVAMWGGGRATPFESATTTGDGVDYLKSSEPNLYLWAVEDYEAVTNWDFDEDNNYAETGYNVNYNPNSIDIGGGVWDGQYDSDDQFEFGYIPSAAAVVDIDEDGSADIAYVPVTVAVQPAAAEEVRPENMVTYPSYIYKVVFKDQDDVHEANEVGDNDDLYWCEFYDPMKGVIGGTDGSGNVTYTGSLGWRPEIYYAPTVAWFSEGGQKYLGVYWGAGTPFDRLDVGRPGYFFAAADKDPESCSYAMPLADDDGFLELADGETLTTRPIVYGGAVYFATYTPGADDCDDGVGRIWALNYKDFDFGGLDTDLDGDADTNDAIFKQADAYISSLVITAHGTLMYGVSQPNVDGSGAVVGSWPLATKGRLDTRLMSWMELF